MAVPSHWDIRSAARAPNSLPASFTRCRDAACAMAFARCALGEEWGLRGSSRICGSNRGENAILRFLVTDTWRMDCARDLVSDPGAWLCSCAIVGLDAGDRDRPVWHRGARLALGGLRCTRSEERRVGKERRPRRERQPD